MIRKYLKEDNNTHTPMIYMNTWKNYNENGADLSAYGINSIADGWLTPEEAVEFANKYAEDEPFINDIDDFPFEVDEMDNIEEVAEKLERYSELSEDEQEAVKAYMETQSNDFDEALDCIESGDYRFYPDIYNFTDLAYEIIDELGGIENAVSDPSRYIDTDQMRREYEWDMPSIMRDSAEQEVEESGISPDSEEFKSKVDEWIDDHMDEWLDSIIDEDVALCEMGKLDLSDYFDYEQYGRDLSYDGFAIASNGIIEIL